MNRNARIIIVGGVWLVLLFIVAAFFRFIVFPHQVAVKEQKEEEKQQEVIQKTSANSRYLDHINFALDSFSGYSTFRSEAFQNELSQKRILLNIINQPNFTERLKSIQSGEAQMAVFTIDALIKASADPKIKGLPASIVAIVDETRGADAMVSYTSAVPNVDAMNDPKMKIVLAPDSPSETMARVVMSHFGLTNLSKSPFVFATDADDVYRQYLAAKPNDPVVFALWEPYVTKMLENPNCQVLVDSSRFRGYIVDVIVCNRDFLFKNEDKVVDFVEAYLRAYYSVSQNDGMIKLVADDARKAGTAISDKQVRRLVDGIWWKNTSENFAHMGLNDDQPLQHVEDMIQNITNVLVSTGAIPKDPTEGKYNLLYYDKVLARLKNKNFHPGLVTESVREESNTLPVLTDEEWGKLVPVGTLQIPALIFPRGTATLTESSEAILNDLVDKLKSWPFYYIAITSNINSANPNDADKVLKDSRGKVVMEFLSKDVNSSRMKVFIGQKKESSVTIKFLYRPY